MERYENIIKIEEIRKLVEANQYLKAYKILETMDVQKIKSLTDLSILADVFTQNEEYERAMELLNRIFAKTKTRRVLNQLVELSIKSGKIVDAIDYLNRYEKLAPQDPYKYVFRYQIDTMRDQPIETLIESLEQLKEYEYIEKWAYELAKLYHKAEMKDACIRECGDIILWFGEGVYVDKAIQLKQYYVGDFQVTKKINADEKRESERRVQLEKTKDYSFIKTQIDHFLAEDELVYEEVWDETYESKTEIVSELDKTKESEIEEEIKDVFESESEEEIKDVFESESEEEIQNIIESEIIEELQEEFELEITDEIKEIFALEIKEELESEIQQEFIASTTEELLEDLTKNISEDVEAYLVNQDFADVRAEDETKKYDQDGYEHIDKKLDRISQLIHSESIIENWQISQKESREEEETLAVIHDIESIQYMDELQEIEEILNSKDLDDIEELKVYSETEEELQIEQQSELENVTYKEDIENSNPVNEIETEMTTPIQEESLEYESKYTQILAEYGVDYKKSLGYFYQINECNQQIEECFDGILDSYIRENHIIITGGRKTGKSTLAKNITKILFDIGFMKTGRVAVIAAEKFNTINIMGKKDKLINSTLIIENAEQLETVVIGELIEFMWEMRGKIRVILEGEKTKIETLLLHNLELTEVFRCIIHLPKYSKDDLFGFVNYFMEENQYSLSLRAKHLFMDYMEEIYNKQLAEEHLESAMALAISVKAAADERNRKYLSEVASTKELNTKEFMQIIREDFR